VGELVGQLQLPVRVLNLGLPDSYIEHGSPAQMLADCGLDVSGIVRQVRGAMPELARASESA